MSTVFLFGEDIMSNELYRAERCRDLAEEYRRIAAMCTSAEMRNHYSRMLEHYSTEAEELGMPARDGSQPLPTEPLANASLPA
jgi:hypothetical protein